MLFARAFLLLFGPPWNVNCFLNNFKIIEFVEEIHKQSYAESLCLVGINEEFLSVFLRTHFNLPVLIFTKETPDEDFKLGNVILMVEISQGYDDQVTVTLLDKLITNLKVRKFAIVSASNIDSLKQWFGYFEDNKFTRIFGSVGNSTFAYLPYATIQIQKLHGEDLLPNAQKDFNGFAFRTTVQKDIPRIFWYPDDNGENQIGGTYGQIFLNFLRMHNATFTEIIVSNSTKLDIASVINATTNNDIDISMNVFCHIPNLDLSYPVKIEHYVIMVALNGYVHPQEYFQRPFTNTVWIYIGLIVVYVTMMDIIFKYCTNLTVGIWASFSQVFLTLLRMPPERPIQNSVYSMHLQMTVLSFIIGNIYVIYFTSYLTVHIKVKQYETIKDLIEHNVRVSIPIYEWSLLQNHKSYPKDFDKLVDLTDYTTYFSQLYSMRNTSVAFALPSEKYEFLTRMQSLHEKPLFHQAKDIIKPYYMGYLLPFNSQFKEILSDFLILIKETGLIKKWETDIFVQATKAGFRIGVDRDNLESAFNPLTMEHLHFSWNCLTLGLTVSAIVFLMERLTGGILRVCKTKNEVK
ncbi:uncharacterized protein LOC129944652 [Eupeodes corollae]|uniref:uncharacterized protein LOC129944652 n=1 Tax=Eupeodes corollae TaxID=290404 RepID=UPI00249250D4|nr:uncharacterized protein LOC129944652 [Eupeodes corollae]